MTQDHADRVLRNAKVFTSNEADLWAEAVAIRGETLVHVGSDAEVERWIGPGTVVTDLKGRLVVPGLIDAHIHPGLVAGSAELATMPFSETYPLPYASKDVLLAWLASYAAKNPDLPAITAAAWRQEDFGSEGPHKRELDAIVPDRPVVLLERWGHGCWLNSKALESMGVTRDTPDAVPDLAYFQRDEHGEPTGWAKEGAGWEALFAQPIEAGPKARKMLKLLLGYLASKGVTTVFDAGNMTIADKLLPLVAELDRAGELTVLYEASHHIILPHQVDDAVAELQRLRSTYGGPNLRFNTIKIHFDGLHTNNTGALLEPYADRPDTCGATLLEEDRVVDLLVELHEEAINLHVHCWGDQSVRTMLNAYERALARVGGPLGTRLTLTHLPLVDDTDLPRFAELGVVANLTLGWIGDVSSEFFEPYLGHRAHHLFRARPLLETGAVVSYSSDIISPGWIDWANPFYSMQAAHTRQSVKGGPDAPVLEPASERLTVEELLTGYTSGGAHQMRLGDLVGSLEVGKQADLVVLKDDLFTAEPRAISRTRVLETIRAGRTVHRRDAKAVLGEVAFELGRRYVYWSNRAKPPRG